MDIKNVVCAVILDHGKIFATQRGYGEFKDGWEFPGGKVEPGETPEHAIVREIREELNTTVEVVRLLDTIEEDYPKFHIVLRCYLCRVKEGHLELLEHEAARWLDAEHLYDVEWLPADLDLVREKVEDLMDADSEGNLTAAGSADDLTNFDREDNRMDSGRRDARTGISAKEKVNRKEDTHMKVLMINGSRRERGCTYTALSIVAEALREEGIDSEIVFVGKAAMDGANALSACIKDLKIKAAGADGFVFGAPVYYASPSGESQMVLDRLFGAAVAELRCKPASVVTSARRAGTTSSLDVLAKYPTINEMPLVSSSYWPMVHGSTPADVLKDEEGVGIMKQLGRNMAWLLKCIDAGKKAGIMQPAAVEYNATNFIR